MNFNEIEDYLRKVRDMDISHLDIEEIKDQLNFSAQDYLNIPWKFL